MCHSDVPHGQSVPTLTGSEVSIALTGALEMPAFHVGAASDAPPVLVIGDVYGRSAFYEHLAARLGDAGFQALVPDFFFRQGPLADSSKEAAFSRRRQLYETGTLSDLGAAIEWLRERSGHRRVGTVGFCMGGTFALNLAVPHAELTTVAYYGFPVPPPAVQAPPPAPLDHVDSLSGPVLAFWGDDDQTVGIEYIQRYVESAAAVNPEFEHEMLSGFGHGFLGAAHLDDPSDPGGATWDRTLTFLHHHLAG